MLNPQEIDKAIANKDAQTIAKLIKENGLRLEGNKLVADSKDVEESAAFWDRRQLIKKILLNS
jgi:hypothetical protein